MPIYEYRCEACDETFEALSPVSAAEAPRECPICGAAAPRIISACAIGASVSRDQPAPAPHPHNHSHRSPIPGYARLCWMDDRSAERFAAYKMGRGAEYDDKAAVREETRKQRGLPPDTPDNSHSPVAKLLARKKAQEAKAASADAAPVTSTPAKPAEPRSLN